MKEHDSDMARLDRNSLPRQRPVAERLVTAGLAVVERFEKEYQVLTDGQYGSVEDFPEVKNLRTIMAECVVRSLTKEPESEGRVNEKANCAQP